MEDRKALRPARRTLRDESCPSEVQCSTEELNIMLALKFLSLGY